MSLPAISSGRAFEKVVLRLVKGGPERQALEAGQLDAILDPASGKVVVLPVGYRGNPRQAGAQELDRYAHGAVDALAFGVGVLDAAGVILLANHAWQSAAGAIAEGENFLHACDDASAGEWIDGSAIAAGLRQVLAGEREHFAYEHAQAHGWLRVDIRHVAGSGAARAVVCREDVTVRRRSELLLALGHTVANALAEAGDAGAALQSVIRAVCEAQGWDCGRYFRLDAAAGLLRFDTGWGVATPAVGRFLERSRGVTLRRDAGLKGRVCQSGQPLWVAGGRRGAGPAALPPETDADGAFVFPVAADGVTAGVLVFSNGSVREPDEPLLQAARSIGTQLARYLQRQEALDALRRSEARFRRLTDLSCDWYWEQDRNFRFTKVVGISIGGGDMLGKTHWELPNLALSETQWAKHKAQLAARWSFCDFELFVRNADGSPGRYCISGEPLYDEQGTFTGYCGTGVDLTRRRGA